MRKILSTMMMVLGVGLFMAGSYISNEASLGEEKVSQAEEALQDHRRPIVGPVRKGVRHEAAENAQEKIGDAKQTIGEAEVTATWLHGTGIALFVIGLGYLISSFSHKKRR